MTKLNNINKGFEAMLMKPQLLKIEQRHIVNWELAFRLFSREVTLSFKIKQKE